MKTSTLVIILALGVGLMVAIGGIGYFGWTVFLDQVAEALDKNAVIQEHVGEIEDIEMDWKATSELEGDDEFAFRVRGPKGSGLVRAEFITVSDEFEEVRSGTLELDSGETYDLLPAAAGDG